MLLFIKTSKDSCSCAHRWTQLSFAFLLHLNEQIHIASLNIQSQIRHWCAVFSVHAESHVSQPWNNKLSFASCSWTDKYEIVKIPVLAIILEKTFGYVLSECK